MNPDSQESGESSYYLKPKPRPRIEEMVLGLLLTCVPHTLLYLYLVYVVRGPVRPPVFIFFGFILLLYMLFAIKHFWQLGNRSIVIGLIIGASLTLLLGLPILLLYFLSLQSGPLLPTFPMR